MASLERHMTNDNTQGDRHKRQIHVIDVKICPPRRIDPVQCGDIIEFKIDGIIEYDIFQVYRDGDDYYPIVNDLGLFNGLGLFNIKHRTPAKDRRMFLSLDLYNNENENESEIDVYLCAIPSSQREKVLKERQCPEPICRNHFKIKKHVEKILLTDEEKNQKVYLHKGDTIELEWLSKRGTVYHIEEKKYCPISGGLYTVEPPSDSELSENKYRKTFREYGMSFLFRLTNRNQIRDITVCIINDKYEIRHIKIIDNNNIPPDIIRIEENDWILFEWNTERKTTSVKIEPLNIDENQQQSIESRNVDELFFWQNEPTHRGFIYHQFNKTGVYCYKTANDQIGTIIVEPQKTIHPVTIFTDQLIQKMKTTDLVQFEWKEIDSQEEPILITIDSNSSVPPYVANGLTDVFGCSEHKCIKIEPFFRHHFHTCETFLFNIPQHGLYNFAYSNNPEYTLISLIVENGIHTHEIIYDEENIFESNTIKINCFDQVQFRLPSERRGSIIYQTDEYGNRLEFENILFQTQQNVINYFMKQFLQKGIYYFSIDIKNYYRQRSTQSSTHSLAIIVLPEIRFHYKRIGKGKFDHKTIITTNANDFIIWEFEQTICHDVIHLRRNETFEDLISCDDRAIVGKNRRCLAFNCKRIPTGASFFSNPDFERVTGSYEDRLISTIIIDPPFSKNSFIVTNERFIPKILYIKKNRTVSWILKDTEPNHRISVESNESHHRHHRNIPIDRNIANYVDGVYHLHTFYQEGEYIIKSDRFGDIATVVVVSDMHIESPDRQVQEPKIREKIDSVIPLNTQIHLNHPNHRNTKIYYTLDGSTPTQHHDNVYLYDRNEGVYFRESGLHVFRTYATEDQKLSSRIIESSPTFVMGDKEPEPPEPPKPPWNRCKIKLSASLQYPNTIYGKIEIEPTRLIDLIDHFELYINNTGHKRIIPSHDELEFQINLPPGKYECYLKVIPKDKDQRVRKSNIVEFVIPPVTDDNDRELEPKDLFILKLTIQGFSNTKDVHIIKLTLGGLNDTEYVPQKLAPRVPTPILLPPPLLKVERVGLQKAILSWNLDESVDQSLVEGYRIILNSKPTERLPPNQRCYELRNLEPGKTNEIQVSVLSHRGSVGEKSKPICIICPQRPETPIIESIPTGKPFSIRIKWKIDDNEQDEITSFKIFLDGKLHEEIKTNGNQPFKYDFDKLQAGKTYAIYIKAFVEQKRLNNYVYQCDIESNPSKELLLECSAPPKGPTPRIELMHSNGIDIVWNKPVEYGNMKIIGYQILKDGRAIGKKLIPLDERRASINDLKIGNRYSLQVVTITDQSDGILLQPGEEYDPERHGHYLPGPKLEVEYTDLVQIPTKIWSEKISGHSALVCWSPVDKSLSTNIQPDSYKFLIWNNKKLTRDNPMIVPLTKDKTNARLKDLQSSTTYKVQLEAYKNRRHQTTNDPYVVSTVSKIFTFDTGSPPDPPSRLYLIASTNTAARIGFDPFIEHNAEIITLRVQCVPVSSQINTKDISMDLKPDSTEFILTNLTKRTDYHVTIYGITEEYLDENRCRDVSQLPKKFKPSDWLPNKYLEFQTSDFEPIDKINIRQATIESIQFDWTLPNVYGSTEYLGQILRWKLEQGGDEQNRELDRNATNAIIPGILSSGLYKISIDSIFSIKINLEDDNDETSRKEIRSTKTETVSVRFRIPTACERPEIYLMGYTTNTIDLKWYKPNMFNIIDHPEKINEQIKIYRRLIGYRIDINGRKHKTLDEDQYQCTLTECQPGKEYKIQLVAQTIAQYEYMNNMIMNDKENVDEPDETRSKELRVQMLKNQDLLRSFQANFEFNHSELNENSTQQKNEIKSLGKIHINWQVSSTKNISHFILQWRSSKDLNTQQKTIASNETSTTIDSCDEKYHYFIEIIIVTNDGKRCEYEKLTIPIPGKPDAPKLWLVKKTDTSFIVEWSEPKLYGIPIIGFQLFIKGKKIGNIIEVNRYRMEIHSRINRIYKVNVCAITNNPQHPRSIMSETLLVITTSTTNLIPKIYYDNDDDNIARIIPLQIESINEEKLYLDWTSFLPTTAIRAYCILYTCLNNREVQTMKVSKRYRQTVLCDLRPGFTYVVTVMAVDKNDAVLYKSDKSTVQMSAPPNAPIVAISERTSTHVKLEWRPPASYGEFTVVGYRIFVNNRLMATLSHDQLTYTLTNGTPCNIYTVHVQALSNEKNIVSPMLRSVQFSWPGIKPGAFRCIDDGQTGTIIVAWEHPQLEDETEKLIGFKLFSENLTTHAVRLHGEYDADSHQATIFDLNNGKYRLWLEIQSEKYSVRTRPITIMIDRVNSLLNPQTLFDFAKCYMKTKQQLHSPEASKITPLLRHTQY